MTEAEPLFSTEADALQAPGEVYRHYKGGIYRIVLRGVTHTESGEVGVVYEHLWPHAHQYWFRPENIFFSPQANGEPRFVRIQQTEGRE